MKTTFITAAIAAMLATGATAGGLAPRIVEAQPAPAANCFWCLFTPYVEYPRYPDNSGGATATPTVKTKPIVDGPTPPTVTPPPSVSWPTPPEKPEKPEKPNTPRGPQGNNGHGNGDQDAPGSSGPNNNAENSENSGKGNSGKGHGAK
tara:strand:+ start:33299 stop:33742 length:444 start_codon:yes stop_codon:yes gene_type:complete